MVLLYFIGILTCYGNYSKGGKQDTKYIILTMLYLGILVVIEMLFLLNTFISGQLRNLF